MRVFIIIAMMFCLTLTTYAQSDTNLWEFTLYVPGSEYLQTISAEGLVKQEAIPVELKEMIWANIHLSPDGRWIAFNQREPNATTVIYLGDLQRNSCCVEIHPDQIAETPNREWIRLIGFSPDNALAVYLPPETDPNLQYEPYPVFLSYETYLVDPETLISVKAGDFPENDEINVQWTPEGIASTDIHWCREGDSCMKPMVPGTRRIRQPFNDQITWERTALWDNQTDYGDRLAFTGEYVTPYLYYPAYPEATNMNPPIGMYVLAWVQEPSTTGWYENPTLIYNFDTFWGEWNEFRVESHWVADGHALFVRTTGSNDSETFVLRRDGERIDIEVDRFSDFLTGTPDGWIMLGPAGDSEEQPILHYQFNDDGVSVSTLTKLPATHLSPIILNSPELGSSVNTPFTPILPPTVFTLG
ncbi:MAG TPA: hypothetical protein PLQ56_22805 [Aggregatilineales bacterium]|nr:hypothetical protein [Aggregatilineales bacterium]